MSFTTDVKKELITHYTKADHCRIAELSAIMLLNRSKAFSIGKGRFELNFDDEEAAKKCFTTISKTLNIKTVFLEERSAGNSRKKGFSVGLNDEKSIDELLEKTGLKDGLPEDIVKKPCCKRAFVRGAFIAGGSISDPEKNYHFEIHSDEKEICVFISDIIREFQISPKISKRRERFIVYIKEGIEIVDVLNVMEAHKALMNYENMRIIREMRGNVNRKVNCETANIGKTIDAAYKQIQDIEFIKDTVGLAFLDDNLKEIAEVRLANPDLPLSALGDKLKIPIGKSGANHRLRKISQIADNLRNIEGEKADVKRS